MVAGGKAGGEYPESLGKTDFVALTDDDGRRRISIWPLIEAGEFSTVAEGLTEADDSIGRGNWVDWIQKQIGRAPAQLDCFGWDAIQLVWRHLQFNGSCG